MECGSNPYFFFFFFFGGGRVLPYMGYMVCNAVKGMVFSSGTLLWDKVYKSGS